MNLKPKRTYENHISADHGGLFPRGFYNYQILDFSSNVNPLGASKNVIKAIKDSIPKSSIYPDSNSVRLRQSLSKYTKLPLDNILVGNGATELIYHFCNAFLSSKKDVLIPIPTFSEYESASRLNGAKIHFFKTFDLGKNLDKFLLKIPRNGCVFLCNPNNPTGTLTKKETVLDILHTAKIKNCLVFLDECFIELVPNSNESLMSHLHQFPNLFILRSLTKSFGLAGLRVGYALGHKKIISLLNKTKIPWNVSIVAQTAAITSLNDPNHLLKAKRLIKTESIYLKNSISKIIGLSVIDSSTNFLLIKTKMDSKLLQKKLTDKKILIRDCRTFRGLNNNFIRVAIKTHKENQMLVSALEKII